MDLQKEDEKNIQRKNSLEKSMEFDSLKKRAIVLGAGPVGLLSSLEILSNSDEYVVDLYESRIDFSSRLQCMRIPYATAVQLPRSVREKLWPNDEIREFLFAESRS